MVSAQVTIKGRVVDKTSQVPLEGAILRAFPSKVTTLTNSYGLFNFTTDRVPDSLVVTLLGYKPVSVAPLRSSENYEIELEPSLSLLNEVVVSTGYQQIAKERTTGSFSFMNEKMIERGVSGDIVSRMEDMVSGLQFDRRSITGDVGTLNLRVRGITTIEASSSPLIVLDNFPFEGSIENINPNDIESISFLKDASAASVWGAKAANGVIVLTSKKGKKNEAMKVHFSGIYTFKEKPDLYYSPDFLESSAYIEVEKKLFGLGFYNAKENQATRPVLSPVVEYLILARDNPTQSAQYMESIERLKTLDIRKDKEKYVYRPAQNQQYYLSLSGGSGLYRYFFSGGYDHELPDKIGVKKERITLKSNQTLDVKPWLSLHGNLMWITGDQTSDGGPNSYIDQYPYNRLKDENGENTEVYTNYRNTYIRQETAKGLLDWRYIPLDEIGLTPANTKTNDLRITTGLQVKITPDIVWDMTYNHLLATTDQTRFNKKESYYVRDLVNRFTQSDGTQRFPYNGLLYKSANRLSGGEFRTQINFRRIDKNRNEWGAMAGAEVRSVVTSSHSSQYFDYNENLLTQ